MIRFNTRFTAALVALVAIGAVATGASQASAFVPDFPEFVKSKSKDYYKGNDNFGGGFKTGGYVMVYKGDKGSNPVKSAIVKGYANVTAKIFKKKLTIADIGAHALTNSSKNEAKAWVKVGGIHLYHKTASTSITYEKMWSRTFLKASATFWAGIIPIEVSASFTGKAGIEVGASAGNSKIKAGVTPKAGIGSVLSLGIGSSKIVGFGIEADLDVITIGTPITFETTIAKTLKWVAKVKLEIELMSGKINFWVKAIVKKWSWELFAWSGKKWGYTLYSQSGSFNLW